MILIISKGVKIFLLGAYNYSMNIFLISVLHHKTGHAHEAYDYYRELYTLTLNQNLHN